MGSNAETKRALFWLEFKANAMRRPNARFLAKNEKRLENTLKRSLNVQKKYVLDHLKDIPALNQKGVRVIEKKGLIDDVGRMLDGMPNKKNMVNDMEQYGGVVMLKAGKSTVKKFKLSEFGIDFALSNSAAVRYMQDLHDLHLSNRYGSISNTTKQDVLSAITDSVLKGDTYSQVAKRIEGMGEEGVFSAARAQRIAVNEIAKAYGFGNRQPLQEYKTRTGRQVWKAWITVGDDLVSEICQENEKQGYILFDEAFASGDMNEPSHINCRCSVAYKFDEEDFAPEEEAVNEEAKPDESTTLQSHLTITNTNGQKMEVPLFEGHVYHATPDAHVEGIAETGIQPRVTLLDEVDAAKNGADRVYFGTNPAMANAGLAAAQGRMGNDGGRATGWTDEGVTMLRVLPDHLNDPKEDPHMTGGMSIFVEHGIDPDKIEIMDTVGHWMPLKEWNEQP